MDATINYALGEHREKISNEDKEVDSLYNTYKHRGLPPGPICNPGLKSIRAASNPIDTEYWYYLTTLVGITIFSETLDEHNEAKAKYLR